MRGEAAILSLVLGIRFLSLRGSKFPSRMRLLHIPDADGGSRERSTPPMTLMCRHSSGA